MTLELLICTIDEGISGLDDSLLPPRTDVRYLVSWQYTGPRPQMPDALTARSDVRVVLLQGGGLCRNRNHALRHATGDVLKICDDDEQWTEEYFDTILHTYREHPEYDIVHFQIHGIHKPYPPRYISSCELTLRRATCQALSFDERFGLGSPFLNACEEAVLLSDARRLGLTVRYVARPVCHIEGDTTGADAASPLLQRSKGAAFCYTHGSWYACYKALRESAGYAVRRGLNPVAMFRNWLWGIRYILHS